MKRSNLELELELQIQAARIPQPALEYKFHPIRKWRFDFAFVPFLLAVEVEGGIWNNGRHNRGAGYESDCEKYNEAMLHGWKVLRVTSGMIRDGRALGYITQLTQGKGIPIKPEVTE